MAKRKSVKNKVRSKAVKNLAERKDSIKIKTRIVSKNLLLFVVLSVLCFLFGGFSANQGYAYFFSLFAIVFGFIGLAFFIVLLILVFLKILKN